MARGGGYFMDNPVHNKPMGGGKEWKWLKEKGGNVLFFSFGRI
jgi:hypothetical protein